MCSSKQVCNGELPLLHHNCGNYRKPSITNAICGQNLAWGPPFFIAFLKTTQNFLQVGYLIYPKSMREKYGLNLYLSLKWTLKSKKKNHFVFMHAELLCFTIYLLSIYNSIKRLKTYLILSVCLFVRLKLKKLLGRCVHNLHTL